MAKYPVSPFEGELEGVVSIRADSHYGLNIGTAMKKIVGVVLAFEDRLSYGGERSLFLANALKPGTLDLPNPD